MASNRRVGSVFAAITSAASLLFVSSVAIQPADAVDVEDLDIFVSSSTGGTVDDVSFADEDILRFNTRTDTWSLFFDGSDMGIGSSDVTGFHIAATEPSTVVHLTLEANRTIPGLGTVNRSDIITFTGASGPNTTGTFTRHFDGSDVGLTSIGENIDAIADDGTGLAISTSGSAAVADAAGDPFAAADEDVIRFTSTTLGADTAGSFAPFFDGSAFGLVDRDLVAASIKTESGELYSTFLNGFTAGGLSTDRDDIAKYRPANGDNPAAFTLVFDGDLHRFGGEQIDGLHVQPGKTPPPVFAGLSLSINDDVADAATPGDAVRYTVTVANNGPGPATDVTVTGDLPSGLTTTAMTGCAADADGLPCFLGNIAPGASVSFTIDTSTDGVSAGTTTMALSVSSETLDNDTSDNAATTDTIFAPPADDEPMVPIDLNPIELGPDSPGAKIFVSSSTGGTVDGISFADEDILVYNTDSDTWAMFFDGSDMNIGNSDVNGFHVVATEPNTIINLTLESTRNITGLGSVNRSDIITFTGTSGTDTAGTFSLLLDGSDLGLTSNAENIDAITKGRTHYAVSTLGTARTGAGPLVTFDEDLVTVAATSFGSNTTGALELLFDGSDLAIDDRDLVAASLHPNGDELFGAALNGVTIGVLSTDRDDVFRFTSDGAIGPDETTGTLSLFFDGDQHRFGGEQIDGLHVIPAPPILVAPIAVGDAYTADEGVVLNVQALEGLLANDSDPDSPDSTLAVTGFDNTSDLGAVIAVNPDGSFSYNPSAVAAVNALDDGETIVDRFDYAITDLDGQTVFAEVTLTVSGSTDNTAPSITSADTANVVEGSGAVIDVESVDATDTEGAGLSYSLTGGEDQALFTIDKITGALSFVSAPVFEKTTSGDNTYGENRYVVEVTVTDSGKLSTTQTITVSVTMADASDNADDTDDSDNPDHTDNTDRSGSDDGNSSPVANPDTAAVSQTGILDVSQMPQSGFGGFGYQQGRFANPYGIAIGPDGSLVIADTDNHRLQICDAGGADCSTFGQFGRDAGQFDYPYSVAITADGRIVIADTNNHRIQICDTTGTDCSTFGQFGRNAGEFDYPSGVAVNKSGQIVIADTNNHRIQICDTTGTGCSTFGQFGRNAGDFDYPSGVAITPDGRIVVADTKNHRAQTCTTDGACTTIGGFGAGPGQFDHPYGVAVDGNGRVVVADTKNHRIRTVGAQPVLANDIDPDGDPLAVTGFDAISELGATVSVNPDGSYRYDPSTIDAIGRLGECEILLDTFTYTIEDGRGGSATTAVTVTVVGSIARFTDSKDQR